MFGTTESSNSLTSFESRNSPGARKNFPIGAMSTSINNYVYRLEIV